MGAKRDALSALACRQGWVETLERRAPVNTCGVRSGRAEPKRAGVQLASDHGTDPRTQTKQCIYVIDKWSSPCITVCTTTFRNDWLISVLKSSQSLARMESV